MIRKRCVRSALSAVLATAIVAAAGGCGDGGNTVSSPKEYVPKPKDPPGGAAGGKSQRGKVQNRGPGPGTAE